MSLNLIDWGIIVLYLIISLSIGFVLTKRAGKDTSAFFLSGRNLPWYIAGTSVVATTFAADTPLAVTELVAKNGIAGKYGEDAHKVLRIIEETRDSRIPDDAVKQKEAIADLARDFGRLNDSAKSGLAGLKARAGAKQAVKNRFSSE